MERHQWKNGDIVRLKEDDGKSWQISKTNDTYGEWFLAEIRDCGIAGGWVSTWTLDDKYEFVNNPIDDAQEAIKKEFDKIRECVKEVSWTEEDERLCQCLIKDQEEALDNVRNDKYGHSEIISDLKEMYQERIAWLKSLRNKLRKE